jgi:hypothetical protein
MKQTGRLAAILAAEVRRSVFLNIDLSGRTDWEGPESTLLGLLGSDRVRSENGMDRLLPPTG